jgi:hypothetical protein
MHGTSPVNTQKTNIICFILQATLRGLLFAELFAMPFITVSAQWIQLCRFVINPNIKVDFQGKISMLCLYP